MRFFVLVTALFALSNAQGPDVDGFRDDRFHHCPLNQKWQRCGPPCGDARCPNRLRELFRCDPRLRCGPEGCYCLPGYVRDHQNRCILEKMCPPQCDGNEQLNSCGNRCEPKCPLRLEDASKPIPCPLICDAPACECKKGFYRAPSGSCVPLEHCPNICSRNEFYNPCGRGCENTCRRLSAGEPNRCTRGPQFCEKQGACQCKNGLYRDGQGKCVPPVECLHCRGRNEILDECASPMECRPHCDKIRLDDRCFRNFDRKDCRPSCVCQDGFVRRSDGACVRRHDCDNRRPH